LWCQSLCEDVCLLQVFVHLGDGNATFVTDMTLKGVILDGNVLGPGCHLDCSGGGGGDGSIVVLEDSGLIVMTEFLTPGSFITVTTSNKRHCNGISSRMA
jgi:hypothetical protein